MFHNRRIRESIGVKVFISNMFKYLLLTTILLMILVQGLHAKKHLFSIGSTRDVVISRSSKTGTKMVKVVAFGSSADKAINQAMVDAVAALSFDGADGQGEMDGCPAVLLNGRKEYESHKDFFDRFFKKGEFLRFVEKVNSAYPSGLDNVKTKNGRRVQILLIVDWKALSDYYQSIGLKTIISELNNY